MYTHLNLTNRLTTCGFTPAENHKLDVPPYRKCKLYDFNQDVSKTWLIEFYQWNVQTQKKQRRFFSRFNSVQNPKKRLQEANKWIAFIDQQLEQGAVYNPDATIPVPKPADVAPLLTADLKAYLSDKKSTLGEDSYKVYSNFGSKLTGFIKDNKLQGLATKDLTPEWCNEYRLHILKLHDHPTTRNKELGQLKTFCIWYTKPGRKRFDVSPAAGLELVPKVESEIHEPYTDEQARSIFVEIEKRQDLPLLLFIYFIHYAFARPGKEVRLMRVGDLKDRSVRIQPGRSKTKITKTPTLAKPLVELLDQMGIRNYPADYFVFGKNGEPGPVEVGKNHFYHRHRQILDDLRIVGKYTLYGWKHTGNIKAIRLGIHSKKLQAQNGFTESRTMDIYTRRLAAFVDEEIFEKFI